LPRSNRAKVTGVQTWRFRYGASQNFRPLDVSHSRTVSDILTRKARRPLTRDRPRCRLSPVQTSRTYGPYVRPVRQAVRTARTAKQLCAQCFLPYGPYVRLVRMGQSYVRSVQRYQMIYFFTVDRHKLRHVHSVCVSVCVCNETSPTTQLFSSAVPFINYVICYVM